VREVGREAWPATRVAAAILVLAAVAALAGCRRGPREERAEAARPRGTIGLSVLTLTNPFFKEIADTMRAEAARAGYDLVAVSGEFDVLRQQNQVKDFIVRKVAAIVLTPCDSKAIGPSIREANEAGIPVFTADIAALDPVARVVAHVATDNYQGGRLAGAAMVEALGGRGKVAILDHPEVESVKLRTRGFTEVVAEANRTPGVAVQIVTVLPGGGARDKSYKAAQDILQAHRDLRGIFAINDPSALGAVAALEESGRDGTVVVIGFDGQPEGRRAIKQGKIYADAIQFPDRIGRETVRAVERYFAGEDLPPQLLVPSALYRKADAEMDPSLGR
jgi:ribose transport system substrate-binding protein